MKIDILLLMSVPLVLAVGCNESGKPSDKGSTDKTQVKAPKLKSLTQKLEWQSTEGADRTLAEGVFEIAKNVCDLESVNRHIEKIRVRVEREVFDSHWLKREYGWDPIVWMDVTLLDGPEQMNDGKLHNGIDPRSVVGHTFTLAAGEGKHPALVAATSKKWIWKQCGMASGYAGENGIRDAPIKL